VKRNVRCSSGKYHNKATNKKPGGGKKKKRLDLSWSTAIALAALITRKEKEKDRGKRKGNSHFPYIGVNQPKP